MPKIIELTKKNIDKISVVCPYFNEAGIIASAVQTIHEELKKLGHEFELILVNDGSTDESFDIVKNITEDLENVVLVTYLHNEGRGYALKRGIDVASGQIIITTEIDMSWGKEIFQNFVTAFEEKPYLDCVIASPHHPEGKCVNVPFKRMLISKIGNFLIRMFFLPEISMNTGMTRGYRKDVIQNLETTEKGKEFHLEVLLKLNALNYRIGEIPAVLEWKEEDEKPDAGKRKSSTNINRTIKTHINFLFFLRPLKYFWVLSFILLLLCLASLIMAFYFLLNDIESLWMVMTSLLFAIFGVLFFGIGVITEQNIHILKELWSKKQHNQGELYNE